MHTLASSLTEEPDDGVGISSVASSVHTSSSSEVFCLLFGVADVFIVSPFLFLALLIFSMDVDVLSASALGSYVR